MKRLVLAAVWVLTLALSAHAAGDTTTGLADATVLVVRHGEKPDSGTGLSPAGEARAQAHVVRRERPEGKMQLSLKSCEALTP